MGRVSVSSEKYSIEDVKESLNMSLGQIDTILLDPYLEKKTSDILSDSKLEIIDIRTKMEM